MDKIYGIETKRKLGYYLGHIFVGLILNQLIENYQDPIVIMGLVAVMIQAFFILVYLKDNFLFVLYLFSLCLMHTQDTLGGIALIPCVLLFRNTLEPGGFTMKNPAVKICIIIVVVTNFLGYVFKNQSDLVTKFQSAIIFIGSIFTFLYVQNLRFTKHQAGIILKVITYISVLCFIVAFNQKFVLIDASFPLLGAIGYPSVSSLNFAYYGRFPSLLGDYELFAEFSLMMFIMAFTLIMDHNETSKHLNFGIFPYILLLSSFLSILMTGTGSGFLLVFLFIIVFFLVRIKSLFSIAAFRMVLVLMLVIPIIIGFGDRFGLDTVIERLKEINTKNLSAKNLKSGEEMNRDIVYAVGYERLAEENWILGYGFGRVSSNKMAWLGYRQFATNPNLMIEDFHSLYLSLPMIYGWIGGIAYIFLILTIIYLLIRKYFSFIDNPIRGVALGLAFMFVFFLIDQFKINSLRYYNYHLMIWMLMGFALSIVNIEKKDENTLVH